ncbi:MAG: hypothetical protein E6J43_08660 [Chloroflexi bacterium]|nr:MAG: hypothetical protein E6J43_08660 [Chloroflexota bacterium]
MTQSEVRTRIKTALGSLPDRYALPSRPSAAQPAMQDAFRQTQFLLSGELELFEKMMNLQLQIVAANSRLRTVEASALFSFWSRAFAHEADACTLMTLGSYSAAPPLVRAACDCVAAQRSLIGDGFKEYRDWLETAVRQDREHTAMAIDLGRFRAGSALAEDERLGSVYRLVSDLSMPHLGATVLQVASDSNLQKMTVAFGETLFHLGWAELISGWLLLLVDIQLTIVISTGVFAVDHSILAVYQSYSREVNSILASRRRCYVEEVDGRYLFQNYRRTASGSPKRLLL